MHQSRFYGEDLLFPREICTSFGSHKITLRDTVENLDFSPAPVFLLYHINFGFPLLDENTYISCPSVEKVVPRTSSAASGLPKARTMTAPVPGKRDGNRL
ncbi:MAG: DUF4432 family protein [Lachnospiraceae bacterium]|jgi:hypothetical protein|nr:DUF4432 family protein [Lachnospiraceae bacterium]MCI8996556.1 DUF4432 family protein [Lachnospiraceae bacterium]MCI9134374.1 DUF4432 family protein [Lachnospiraceae bacterium]